MHVKWENKSKINTFKVAFFDRNFDKYEFFKFIKTID